MAQEDDFQIRHPCGQVQNVGTGNMLIMASLKCNHTLLASLLSTGKRTAGLAELWQLTTKKPTEELRKNASTAQRSLPTGQKRHGQPVIIVTHSSGDRQKQARWLQSLKITRWFVSACSRKNTHGFAECTRLCQGKSTPPVPYNNSPLSASANPLSTFKRQKELQKRCTQQHFRPVLN